jgi:hypothetical protein
MFTKLARIELISEHHNSGRSGVQPENTPTAEKEGISSDGCTHEHNVRTDHVISSPVGTHGTVASEGRVGHPREILRAHRGSSI